LIVIPSPSLVILPALSEVEGSEAKDLLFPSAQGRLREGSALPSSRFLRCERCPKRHQYVVSPYRRGSDKRGADSVTIVTTGLSFDQNTGIASTDQKVQFWFARGQGSAKGADYDPQTQQLTLRSAVEFALLDVAIEPPRTPRPEFPQTSRSLVREERSASMGDNNEALTHIRAGNLRFQEGQSSVHLGGPVELIRNTRRLQAGESEILLDERRQARRIRLEGGVLGVDQSADRAAEVRARRAFLDLSERGKLQDLQLEEDVNWTSSIGGSKREGSAQRVELSYSEPAGLLERIVAIQDARVVLRDAPGPSSSATGSASVTAGRRTLSQGPVLGAGTQTLAGQRIEMTMAPDGETLRQVSTRSRSTLELVPYSPSEDPWRVEGEEFDMGFDPAGNLTRFAAERTVRVIADSPNRPSARRISTSDHFTATLDPRARSIARIEQWGRYQYQDAEKQARAERADYSGEREVIVLRGEAVVWNATGKLSANRIALDNATGNVQAEGNVSTTYLPTPRSEASDSLPIHAVAERLQYDSTTGKAEYQGHVRLWQGNSLLEAGWVELDRRQRQLEARGKVYSVFTQLPVKHAKGSAENRSARAGETEPTEIRSEDLLYKEDERRATYRGEVRMRSASATVHSGELEVFFAPPAGGATVTESGRIERAVASREVVILDSGRKATADRAEYFPEEARVLLFGKPATVTDPQRGNTRGVRLTYRMGDDRIFVEGEPGLPAETRRQVHR